MCQMVSPHFFHVYCMDWSRGLSSHLADYDHRLHHTGAGHRHGVVVLGRRDVHT